MASTEEILISFGASVGGLLQGVQAVTHAIEGVRAPVDHLKESFGEFLEAAGIAFAVEQIGEFAEKMAEIGEHAVNMGAALGISSEQFQTLSESMQLVGGSGDTLVRVLRLVSRAAETAVGSDLSRQADAFRALGIDAKTFAETLQNEPIAALKELAETAVRTGNTTVQSALGQILGRSGGAELFAYFSQGAAGIDKMQQEVVGLGAPTKDALEHLKDMAEQVNGLKVGFTNLGLAIADALHGPLTDFVLYLKDNLVTLQDWTKLLSGTGRGSVELTPRGEEIENLQKTTGATTEEAALLAELKKRESGGDYRKLYGESGPGSLSDLSRFPMWEGKDGSHAAGAYQFQPGTYAEMASITGRHDFLPASQDVNALELLRQRGVAPWSTGQAALAAVRGGGGGAPASAAGETLPEVNVSASGPASKVMMQNTEAEKKALDEKLKNIDEERKAREAELDFEIQAAKGNEDKIRLLEQQKLAIVQGALQQRQALITAASAAVQATESNSVVGLINVQRRALAEQQKFDQQQVENANRLLDTRIRAMSGAVAEDLKQVEERRRLGELGIQDAAHQEIQIVAAHKQAVDAILAQEQENAAALPQLWQKLAERRVELENQTVQQIRNLNDRAQNEIRSAAHSTAEGISHDISGALVGVITRRQTPAQAAGQLGENVLQKIMDTVIDKLIVQTITNVLTQIASDAANTGILATLLTALTLKPSVLGTTFAQGGIVSAAGGWTVPSTGRATPALLHPKEMVLPAPISEGLQGMIANGGTGGGGHTFNLNVQAMDGASVMKHGPAIVASINSALRNGASLRPNGSY